jgi:hypothetical protein
MTPTQLAQPFTHARTAIHATVLPELCFDDLSQLLIFLLALTEFLHEPLVVAAARYAHVAAQAFDGHLICVTVGTTVNEAVFHFGIAAKKLTAFFRMSRSSSTC